MAVKNCFIRGSVVRYVKMAARNVDTTLLEDATRRGTLSLRSSYNCAVKLTIIEAKGDKK